MGLLRMAQAFRVSTAGDAAGMAVVLGDCGGCGDGIDGGNGGDGGDGSNVGCDGGGQVAGQMSASVELSVNGAGADQLATAADS